MIKQVMGRWVTANCEMENLLGVEVGNKICTSNKLLRIYSFYFRRAQGHRIYISLGLHK